MKVQLHARSVAVLFFGAFAAFLSSTLLAAPLALWGARLVGPHQTLLRLLLGVATLDLIKAPALLLAAWLVAPGLTLRPPLAATTLVSLTFGIEVGMAALLDQHRWLADWRIVLCRGLVATALVWLCTRVVRRRRG